jgi:peptidyl-prolyl cis-trans isomerase SurA
MIRSVKRAAQPEGSEFPRDVGPNLKFRLQLCVCLAKSKAARTMKNRNHASVLASRLTLGLTSIFTLVVMILLTALVPASVHAQAKPAADADIVVRVNNDVITLSDYQKAEQQLRDEAAHDCQGCPQDRIDAQFKQQEKDLLRGMIDQALMIQRAKDMGISAEAGMLKRLDEVRKQNGLATLDDLQKGVEASGLSWEDYKTTIRNGLLQKEVVQREVGSRVDISSGEVKQYYEAHPQEFTLPERVTLSEISVRTEGKNAEEFAALRSKAAGLRTSVLNGDDFSQVARLYSQGSTAKDGGVLGTFKRGELSPQIEDVVFQMSKGQISEVIQTRTDFEFLRVDDHLQAGLQPLDNVEADIRNTIHAQKVQPLLRDYLAELREQSNIIVKPGYNDSALLSGANVTSPDKSQL